jgi:hypothetical protein
MEGKPGLGSDWIFWGETWGGSKVEAKKAAPPEAKIRVLDAFGSKEYQDLCYEIQQDTYGAKGVGEDSSVELHPLLQKKQDLYLNATSLVPIPDVAMSTAASAVLYDELQGMLLHQVTVEEAMAHIDEALAIHDEYA